MSNLNVYTAVALPECRLLFIPEDLSQPAVLWSNNGWQLVLSSELSNIIPNGSLQDLECIPGVIGILGAFTTSTSTSTSTNNDISMENTLSNGLVLVTEVVECGHTILDQPVYRVINGCCVQLDNKQSCLFLDRYSSMSMAAFVEMSSGTLYFSPTGHLLTLTGSQSPLNTYNNNNEDEDDEDDTFLWNAYLLQRLTSMNGGHCTKSLQLQVIRGFFNQRQLSHNVRLTLISRMSRYRAGTRFLRRGIDHMGNTAITVETEMIVSTPTRATTWTVMRGSIPLPWHQEIHDIRQHPKAKLQNIPPSPTSSSSSSSVSTNIQCNKRTRGQVIEEASTAVPTKEKSTSTTSTTSSSSSFCTMPQTIPAFSDETREAFARHVQWIQSRYGSSVTFANLIREHSCTEALLSQAFRLIVQQIDLPNVSYISTPVLRRSGSLHDAAANAYTYASRDGFTMIDIIDVEQQQQQHKQQSLRVLCRQQGCLRVNCMDCLDRTGMVQFRVAMLMLPQMLMAIDESIPTSRISKCMRVLWADNNDVLAQQYTGTNTIAGWLVRYGGRCHLLRRFYDMKILLSRAYINTLVDPTRQLLFNEWHGLNSTSNNETSIHSSYYQALREQATLDVKSIIPLDSHQYVLDRILNGLLHLRQRTGPNIVSNMGQFIMALVWLVLFTLFANLLPSSHSIPPLEQHATTQTTEPVVINNTSSNTMSTIRERRRVIRQA
ncbi:SacI homology domain-containing protein [Syncephalis plumigaleata]|nr:SacI homology domain-containing protein [Syncephalis plumigaleata]